MNENNEEEHPFLGPGYFTTKKKIVGFLAFVHNYKEIKEYMKKIDMPMNSRDGYGGGEFLLDIFGDEAKAIIPIIKGLKLKGIEAVSYWKEIKKPFLEDLERLTKTEDISQIDKIIRKRSFSFVKSVKAKIQSFSH